MKGTKKLQSRVRSMEKRRFSNPSSKWFVDLKTCKFNTHKQCIAACKAACTGPHLSFVWLWGWSPPLYSRMRKPLYPCAPATHQQQEPAAEALVCADDKLECSAHHTDK